MISIMIKNYKGKVEFFGINKRTIDRIWYRKPQYPLTKFYNRVLTNVPQPRWIL